MRPYNLGRATSSIIASSQAVSLTGANWKCRHKDAWTEQHTVFFAECTAFYQNTTSSQAPTFRSTSTKSSAIRDISSWVIEAQSGEMYARVRLQILNGDYKHGHLLVDIESIPTSFEINEVVAQLITANFVSYQLDTLKIFALSNQSQKVLDTSCSAFKSNVFAMSLNFIPQISEQVAYTLESTMWYESTAGAKSLTDLSWLKKRLERVESLKTLETKEKKRPFLFNLLTLGRKRKKQEKMIHPLDKIRRDY